MWIKAHAMETCWVDYEKTKLVLDLWKGNPDYLKQENWKTSQKVGLFDKCEKCLFEQTKTK